MNVAICFFGLTRGLDHSIRSIRKNIFNIVPNHDVFVHTYSKQIAPNIHTQLHPKKIQIDNQDDFDKTIHLHKFLTKGKGWPRRNNANLILSNSVF